MWCLFIGLPLKTDSLRSVPILRTRYILIPSKRQLTYSYFPSMAANLSASTATTSLRKDHRISNSFHLITQKPISISAPIRLPPIHRSSYFQHGIRRNDNTKSLTVCFVLDDRNLSSELTEINDKVMMTNTEVMASSELQSSKVGDEGSAKVNVRISEKLKRKRSERATYLIAAVMSSFGITSMAVMAVYYRFYWQMEGAEVPLTEMFGTFALSVGAAVGMEFWARWAHKALWHASLWHMHESHHKPRDGPFELNDVFAIINAVPAVALLSYGFFHRGLIPGLCFGAGLGITVFGMAYMFVHDGLVHKRFSVGPIANVPYFRKVAAAHQLHHTDKFNGVPYGLFLGPKEVEEVGGQEELDKEINRRIKLSKGS